MVTSQRSPTDTADVLEPVPANPQRARDSATHEDPVERTAAPEPAEPEKPLDRLALYLLGPTVYCA